MRLFTAIELPDDARNHLRGLVAFLQSPKLRIDPLSWVRPENLHITLKFLGEVDEEQLDELRVALATVAIQPMKLNAEHLERFPKLGPSRVIAAGLHGDLDPMREMFDGIESVCAPLGNPPEKRRYTPHITLGRSRRGLRKMGNVTNERSWQLLARPDIFDFAFHALQKHAHIGRLGV